MAVFPKIQSPCPYKGALSEIMDGEICRLCKREVHDLTEMSDEGRVAFLADCAGEVCVSYRLPIRRAAAATAMIAALAAPLSAAAEGAPDPVLYDLIVGGITDLKAVQFVEDPADATLPELPVVVEATAPAAAPQQADVTPQPPGS